MFPPQFRTTTCPWSQKGICSYPPTHEAPKFSAQVVSPYFDPTIAKGWICHCRQHHPKTCCSQEDAAVTNLELIDCESLTVEQGRPQAPYVALSYVWGSSTACGQYALESTLGSTVPPPFRPTARDPRP